MTKDNVGGYRNIARDAAGILLLILMPAVSYGLFEYVTGNLTQISRRMAVLNMLWIFVMYLIVFALSGSSRITVFSVSVFLWVLSLAETFVVSFRGTPIMLWDVLALGTALTVAENYVFDISAEMRNAGLALAACNLLIWLAPVRIRGWKKRLLAGCGGAAVSIGLAAFFFLALMPASRLGLNMWAIGDTYQEYGYILATAVSTKYMVRKPPHGYSLNKLREQYSHFDAEDMSEQTAEAKTVQEKIQPVNLICIMNESLSDLKSAGDFTTNQPYFPFIDSLEEHTVRGSLCVPVFGSMTSNTEFEFLTGDSVAMLPAGVIAYQFYVKPGAATLVSTLKAQGFFTVAMHPYPAENWNRDVCYRNMGFDEFLAWDSYDGSELLRNYVSDQADYQKIIAAVEGKETPEDRLFVFNVTMQNHGGYEEQYENFPQQIHLTGTYEGQYPKTDQYLSLMKETDEAFQFLLEYFSDCEEPTMIVMFGDHQPGVEDEFYDAIAGRPSTEVPDWERLMWYETPFLIWTNYEQPHQEMGRLGAVYLSSHVLRLAGLEMTPYDQFRYQMSQVLPVLHPIGLYEPDGTYYSWAKGESQRCPYQELVMEYEYLVYNHSLDRRKMQEWFTVP